MDLKIIKTRQSIYDVLVERIITYHNVSNISIYDVLVERNT